MFVNTYVYTITKEILDHFDVMSKNEIHLYIRGFRKKFHSPLDEFD